MRLSVEQEILVESRVANESKSTGLAYVLWFFFGWLGLHRLYVGSTAMGLTMLVLTFFGVVFVAIGSVIGVVLLALQALWLLLDLFFIPSLVGEDKARIRARLVAGMGGS